MRGNLFELLAIELAIDECRKQFGVAVVCHRVHRVTSPCLATELSPFVDGRISGVPEGEVELGALPADEVGDIAPVDAGALELGPEVA